MHKYQSSESKEKRLLLLGELIIFIVTAPLLLFPGRSAYMGLLLIPIQAGLRRLRIGRWFPGTPFDIPIALLFLTSIVGLIVSVDLTLSLNRFYVLVLGMSCFYAVTGWIEDVRSLRLGTIVWVLGTAGIAILSVFVTNWEIGQLIQFPEIYHQIPVLLHSLPGSGVPNNAGDLAHPRLVSGSMAVLLPLPLALAAFGKGRCLRLLGLFAAVVIVPPLLLSQSPQAFLGLAVALAVILIWRNPRHALWLLPAALAVLAIWQIYHWWLPVSLVERLYSGFRSRLVIWPKTIQMLRDMSFTGMGLNVFPRLYPLYSLGPRQEPHAHNLLLQTAADQGILGVVALLALVLSIFIVGWRVCRVSNERNLRAVVLGAMGGWSACLGYGIGDSLLLGHKPGVALWVLLGLLAAAVKIVGVSLPSGPNVKALRWINLGLAAVVLLSSPVWANAFLVNLGRVDLHKHQALSTPQQVPLDLAQTQRDLEFADLAIQLYPKNSRAYLLAGLVHLEQKEGQEAVFALERSLELDNSDHSVHFQIAEAYDQLGRQEEAFLHWQAAGAEHILFQRGVVARESGDLDEAERWFTLVVRLDPASVEGLYQLADVSFVRSQRAAQAQDWPAAQRAAERAAELYPVNGRYLIWLGDLYQQQGRYEAALAQYEQAVTNADELKWIWLGRQRRGLLFTEMKDWQRAVDEYQAVIQSGWEQGMPPDQLAQNLALLGRILLKMGQAQAAQSAIMEALALDPANALAQNQLKELRSP